MISEGYEKAIFDSPVSDRLALTEAPDKTAHGSTRVITEEFDLLRNVRNAARIVKAVVESTDTLFGVVVRRHLGRTVVHATRMGAALMNLSRMTEHDMTMYFPQHGYNPFVQILFDARKQMPQDLCPDDWWKQAVGDDAVRAAGQLNAFVADLRAGARTPEFKTVLERYRRSCDKNTRSMRRYIDAIFRYSGSRHLVIRLDLGYAMEESWATGRQTSVTLKQAKKDLVKFQRYLRDHLPTTGFAAKLEYGLLRGYHFHALIFLNGHLMQKDVLIAQTLGEHWRSVICEGQGRYWNCNAEHYEDRGIGMVDYTDGLKRAALVNKVATYLTKVDFWLRFQPGGKTLFKWLMPQPRPMRGRPRLYASE
jgi:hypothetical protein